MRQVKIRGFSFKVDGKVVVDPENPVRIVKGDIGDIEIENPYIQKGVAYQDYETLAEGIADIGGENETRDFLNRAKRSKAKSTFVQTLVRNAKKFGVAILDPASVAEAMQNALSVTLANRRVANRRNDEELSNLRAFRERVKEFADAGDFDSVVAMFNSTSNK